VSDSISTNVISVKDLKQKCPSCVLLQLLPIPDQVWEDVSIDFIEGLPKSKGKTTISVVVDRLSKYAHFTPISHSYTARSIASVFIDNIYKLYGMPRIIVSDRDCMFISNFWREF